MRRGQAMVETLIALLAVTFIFMGAYRLSRLVAARTLLDHAAARAARAKSVGFNDWMCEKSARVAMIPVAGERIWPEEGGFAESSRIPIYLSSPDGARAHGILDYEWWHATDVDVASGLGVAPRVESSVRLATPDMDVTGRAAFESHFPFYMHDQGR
ncbi:MAG: hypothetical protein K6F50_06355 [Kiritimatiellae bacterium]|nr:hypothetical protein [Kiritimatiellia bacterium]